MKVSFTGAGELKTKFTKFEKKMLTREVMAEAAGLANTLIVDHTLSGTDKNGKTFKGYTENYERIKAKRGGGNFEGHVNLMDKGHMLGNLTFKATNDSAFLFFPKPKEQSKALGHILGVQKRGLPIRDFFGLNSDEESQVIKVFDNHLNKNAKEFNR